MQDAQGRKITEVDTRILEVGVQTLAGDEVTIRERFCIARVRSTIISLESPWAGCSERAGCWETKEGGL